MIDAMNELRGIVMHAGNTKSETGIPRVAMIKGEVPPDQLTGVFEPMLNLVLQGAKSVTIGDQTLFYDQASYFVLSVDVPATGEIHQGGPDSPYLAVCLTLDPSTISAMLIEMPQNEENRHTSGFSVSPVTPELIDAWLRMMRLIDRAEEIPVLAPLIEREILFRVFQGPQGWMLRQIARADSHLSQIRRAIGWIREHYAEPFLVNKIAAEVGMSVSAFHRHFKAITAMSPIQYQKRLRLLEARRRLMYEPNAASSIAFLVGYESASHFNREYARLFGMPPARDAKRMDCRINAMYEE